ncbi:Glycine cleavage system H protein [Rhizoctonia solani]|uniref:Glycine cleavage system H protein n=1 Tax=Rhizoctonia solani TaxID=456999 RepID=A0A8H7IJF2_9AGAM|nr:Glycine cleavage system H protein [Rhizoctonia solani]
MYRAIYASPFRATSLVRPHIIPRSTVFARTIVTKRYTKDHEWISYDSETKIGTISITKYAQSQLGDVVFVELASKGTTVEIGDSLGAVESVKAASDIYAPASGTIKELNSALEGKPSLLNESQRAKVGTNSFGDSGTLVDIHVAGWLCKIEVSDPSEIEKLYTEEQYKKFCQEGS